MRGTNRYTEVENKRVVVDVFLDFTRVFETISRNIFVTQLHEIGIQCTELNWSSSHLDGRQQKVKYNEHISEFTYVRNGVPQGTVSGPILFLIHMNDLWQNIRYCQVDNATLY